MCIRESIHRADKRVEADVRDVEQHRTSDEDEDRDERRPRVQEPGEACAAAITFEGASGTRRGDLILGHLAQGPGPLTVRTPPGTARRGARLPHEAVSPAAGWSEGQATDVRLNSLERGQRRRHR